jgi:hypothetical protein
VEQGIRTDFVDRFISWRKSGDFDDLQLNHLRSHVAIDILNMDPKALCSVPVRGNSKERKSKDVERRAFGRRFKRRTCLIWPWSGPLLRPRPATQLTLLAFLPTNISWAHCPVVHEDSAMDTKDLAPFMVGSEETRRISSKSGQLVNSERDTLKNALGYSCVELIKRATDFWMLEILFDTTKSRQGRRGGFPSQATDGVGPRCATLFPSYAEMAAHPPPSS